MRLTIIAAIAENGVIGRDGGLPWRLSSDLKRFKQLTMGNAILMGRKTWESIGRPLPGRKSVVISRQSEYDPGYAEVIVAANLDEALAQARNLEDVGDELFVIGGARIYEMCLSRADRMVITRVHVEVEGDVWFPEVDWGAWELLVEDPHEAGDNDDYAHTYEIWLRKS